MNSSEFFRSKGLKDDANYTSFEMRLFAEQYLLHHVKLDALKTYRKILDFSKISNIELGGVDTKDYPEFADAFIQACDYDGEPATDEMLEVINEDGDYLYSQIIKKLV